ncbi:MAG TPA: hypothetical protein VK125_07120 [Bacillota bacterium]|nr:hypothetical protein [Bacillota bacterium]
MVRTSTFNIAGLLFVGAGLAMLALNCPNIIKKINGYCHEKRSEIDDVGIPGQQGLRDAEHMANAEMVSEGSQYGVQYYNEVKSKE